MDAPPLIWKFIVTGIQRELTDEGYPLYVVTLSGPSGDIKLISPNKDRLNDFPFDGIMDVTFTPAAETD